MTTARSSDAAGAPPRPSARVVKAAAVKDNRRVLVDIVE